MDLWDLTDFSLHSNYRLLGPDWDADTPLKNGARNCGLDLRGPRTAPGEEALLLPDAGASVVSMTKETIAEFRQDIILGVGFLVLALVALRRIRGNVNQSGSETVITTFYSLIFATSVLRAVWFLIPSSILKQGYVPEDVHAFDDHWVGAFVSEILLSIGSLTLFSVFILIVIYWADLLKKIFKDSVRPSHPMTTFLTVAGFLMAAEGINSCLFLADVYSSEGMILFNSVLLTVVSLVCSVEISRFSQRFRTVLQTLGAINQVSTEAQVKGLGEVPPNTKTPCLLQPALATIHASLLSILKSLVAPTYPPLSADPRPPHSQP
ncbi:unnamed protein product [Discosporangium mesarthrocarpum]